MDCVTSEIQERVTNERNQEEEKGNVKMLH